jgi:hypothetical protein
MSRSGLPSEFISPNTTKPFLGVGDTASLGLSSQAILAIDIRAVLLDHLGTRGFLPAHPPHTWGRFLTKEVALYLVPLVILGMSWLRIPCLLSPNLFVRW